MKTLQLVKLGFSFIARTEGDRDEQLLRLELRRFVHWTAREGSWGYVVQVLRRDLGGGVSVHLLRVWDCKFERYCEATAMVAVDRIVKRWVRRLKE